MSKESLKGEDVGVVVTTFNQPRYLNLVLDSISRQTVLPSFVLVSDDGSNHNTTKLCSGWSRLLPLVLVWQPDNGFRAARARNLALLKSIVKYVVFIDGDCVLPADFISRHLKLAEPKTVIAGGRRLLDKLTTEQLLNSQVPCYKRFMSSSKFKYLPLGFLRDSFLSSWRVARTCNMSCYREDLERVAGFDESFTGWGFEDSDLVIRLMRSGCRVRSARFAACVLHLWHAEAGREFFQVNKDSSNQTINASPDVSARKSVLG